MEIINMDEKEAIKVLHLHQKWRRGAKMEMPSTPKELGEAIDIAIIALRKSVKK